MNFWSPQHSSRVYATLDSFLADVVDILRGGWKRWLDLAIEMDNAVLAAAPAEVTLGFHLCRGNQASRWLAEGAYDRIAPAPAGRKGRGAGPRHHQDVPARGP